MLDHTEKRKRITKSDAVSQVKAKHAEKIPSLDKGAVRSELSYEQLQSDGFVELCDHNPRYFLGFVKRKF